MQSNIGHIEWNTTFNTIKRSQANYKNRIKEQWTQETRNNLRNAESNVKTNRHIKVTNYADEVKNRTHSLKYLNKKQYF